MNWLAMRTTVTCWRRPEPGFAMSGWDCGLYPGVGSLRPGRTAGSAAARPAAAVRHSLLVRFQRWPPRQPRRRSGAS